MDEQQDRDCTHRKQRADSGLVVGIAIGVAIGVALREQYQREDAEDTADGDERRAGERDE